MKTLLVSMGVLLGAYFQINAQIVSPQVLPVNGAVLQGGGVTLSSTLGQPFTQTLTVGNESYTSGFQQPEISRSAPSANLISPQYSTICAGGSVTIQLNVTGGTPPYTMEMIDYPNLTGIVVNGPDASIVLENISGTTTFNLIGTDDNFETIQFNGQDYQQITITTITCCEENLLTDGNFNVGTNGNNGSWTSPDYSSGDDGQPGHFFVRDPVDAPPTTSPPQWFQYDNIQDIGPALCIDANGFVDNNSADTGSPCGRSYEGIQFCINWSDTVSIDTCSLYSFSCNVSTESSDINVYLAFAIIDNNGSSPTFGTPIYVSSPLLYYLIPEWYMDDDNDAIWSQANFGSWQSGDKSGNFKLQIWQVKSFSDPFDEDIGSDYAITNIIFSKFNNWSCNVNVQDSTFSICSGQSKELIWNGLPGGTEVQWVPATALYTDAACTTPYEAGSNANPVYAKPTTTTIYTATFTNSSYCGSDTSTDLVNVYGQFTYNLSPSYVACDGQHSSYFPTYFNTNIQLHNDNGPGSYTIMWTGPEGGFGPDSTDPAPNPEIYTPGLYTLILTDQHGCSDTAITSIYTCCGPFGGPTPPIDIGSMTSTQLLDTISFFASGSVIGNYVYGLSKLLEISGVITLDGDLYFLDCPFVFFGEGSQMIVPSGKNLFVWNSSLSACSDYLWKGIEVESGGSIDVESSVIAEAQYGILGFDQATISAEQSHFLDDFVGCYLQGPSTTLLGRIHTNYPFVHNFFLEETGFKLPYRYPTPMMNSSTQPNPNSSGWGAWPWAGIQLDNIQSFTIGVPGSSGGNTFTSIANGIISNNSNLNSYNSYGYNLQKFNYSGDNGNGVLATGNFTSLGGFSSYLNVKGNNSFLPQPGFYGCITGITGSLMRVNATQNTIQGQTGIMISNGNLSLSQITNNNITATSTGIQSVLNDNGGGININSNNITISGQLGGDETGISHTGYSLVGKYGSNITNNIITMNALASAGILANAALGLNCSTNTVYVNDPVTNLYGIEYSYCDKIQNSYNFVESTGSTASVLLANSPAGIFVDYSPGISYTNYHTCNNMQNIYTEMEFENINTNSMISGNHFNYNPGGSTPGPGGSCYYGLLVDNTANIDNQNNQANKWEIGTGYYATNGAAYCPNAGILSQFTTSETTCDDLSDYPPSSYPPGWFGLCNDGCTCTEICLSTDEPPTLTGPGDSLTSYDMDVINDSVFDYQFTTEMAWQRQKLEYEKLLNDTALIDSSIVVSFYTAMNASVTGKLVRMDEMIKNAVMPDSSTLQQLISLEDSITSSMQNIGALDSARYLLLGSGWLAQDSAMGAGVANAYYEALDTSYYVAGESGHTTSGDTVFFADSIFVNLLDSMVNDTVLIAISDSTGWMDLNSRIIEADSMVGVYQQAFDSIKNGFNVLRNGRIAIVLDSNAAISTSLDIEQGYVDVNTIYLNTAAQDNAAFDSSQLARLMELAFECPMQGGEAVFRARSLLALVMDTFYIDDNLCSGDTTHRMAKAHQKDTIPQQLIVSLYPNPANNYTTLQLNKDVSPLQLKVLDGMGRIVINEPIVTTGGLYTINTSTFNSGIYYVALYSSEQKIYGGKLSIFTK